MREFSRRNSVLWRKCMQAILGKKKGRRDYHHFIVEINNSRSKLKKGKTERDKFLDECEKLVKEEDNADV